MTLSASAFDYYLPPELIAQTPIEPRDASRLLVLHRREQRIEHRLFRDIVSYLHPGDLLVANESRVIPARLFGHKVPTGGKVEMLLISKRADSTWEVLLKPGRRVKPGTTIAIHAARPEPLCMQPFGAPSGTATARGTVARDLTPTDEPVTAEVVGVTAAGGRVVAFSTPIEPLLDRIGVIPLPPYIHTPLDDPERYQTIYARMEGSVAAPTAGLHFTPELVQRLRQREVQFTFVTLHISMDTFRPVQEEDIASHHMYSEYGELPQQTAECVNRARTEERRVIAVGTTTVRVLETAGAHLPPGTGALQPFAGTTDLFIYPGFRFRVVDALITNFHLPRSTLLMLVAAFAGKELVDRAYQEAIRQRYRFYSFGDAMLIL